MEGHLDGNLCRCTGYKPILQAAKTFVTEDLKGQLAEEDEPTTAESEKFEKDVLDLTRNGCAGAEAATGVSIEADKRSLKQILLSAAPITQNH